MMHVSPGLASCLLLTLVAASPAPARPAAIPAESVVVLYNSKQADSKSLAQHYAKARSIPGNNLVGLPMPASEEISRQQFEQQIRDPLRRIYDTRKWWERGNGANGLRQPVSIDRRILVTMRGVPSKIARTPGTIPPNQLKKRPFAPNPRGDEASVDSELCLLGIEGYDIAGQVTNPYFGQNVAIMNLPKANFLVVGRVDAPSTEICIRMIDDARAVEERGLWGMTYLDLARKGKGYEVGDQWLLGDLREATG